MRQICRNSLSVLALVFFSLQCTKKKPENTEGLQERTIITHVRRAEEKSLDPVRQFDAASKQIIASLYDTLLQYHYLKRPLQLEPALLAKMPEDQGKSLYLFTLREGIRFHDNPCFAEGKGREMIAEDVVYSFKRFADANQNRLSYSLVQGLIEGMDRFRELSRLEGKNFRLDKHEISGLKVIDRYRFSLQFKQESPINFQALAFEGMSIVPREAVEKYGEAFDKNPVGTGPFMMKSYSRRGTTVLVRNPHYFGKYPSEGMPEDQAQGLLKDAGRSLPLVEEVQLPLIEETQTQLLKFKKGEIAWVDINRDDFQLMIDGTGPGTFALKKDFATSFVLTSQDRQSTEFIRFNMKDPLIGKNKALRQAFALALDAEDYIKLLFNGRGRLAESIVPLEIPGNAKETGAQWYRFNKEQARQKLKEAGFPDGKGLPVFVMQFRSATKDQRQRYEYLRHAWAEIGIKLEAEFQTFSTFLKKMEEGNFQLADHSWNADYPDAENFYALLYGKNGAPGPNSGSFQHPAYDANFEKIRYMQNGVERLAVFKEMNALIKEEVPVLLLRHEIRLSLGHKLLRNYKKSDFEEFPYRYLSWGPQL